MAGASGSANSSRPRPRLQQRGSEQLELRVDPIQEDVDDHLEALHQKVTLLRHVAQDIGHEAKSQNEFLDQLEWTMKKAQAGLKSTMTRLNRTMAQSGSNHMLHVVLFALACFFAVYLWIKLR